MGLLTIAAFLTFVTSGLSQTSLSTSTVLRVEEDWELVISDPDVDGETPQICCVMSPTRDLDSEHLVVNINHRSQPTFQAGGVQLQIWKGATPENAKPILNTASLSHGEEIIRWTQRIRVADGQLIFEVVDGDSMTWGRFGKPGELSISTRTLRTNLNAYHPRVSVANSGVTFGKNRVHKFILREVRAYDDQGLLWRGGSPDSEADSE